MYKYSDILFCLREEYLKNREELIKLEKIIRIKRNNREVKFHLEQNDNEEYVELYYELSRKQGIIKDITEKLLGYNPSYETGKMAKTFNRVYQPDTKEFDVKSEYNQYFEETIKKVQNNPFTNNSFNIFVDNDEENINIDRKIRIYPDKIFTYRRNNTECLCSGYDSVNDEVLFSNNKRKMNYDDMYMLLDMEFPKDKFPQYIQYVIESKKEYGLNAYVYDNDDHKKDKVFEPIVEEKRLILVRK